jgi:hypothetical protein
MCDGNILEGDVELLGTLEKIGSYSVADCFSLGDEFCGIELGDDRFQDFVSNGGENTLIVILTEVLLLVKILITHSENINHT